MGDDRQSESVDPLLRSIAESSPVVMMLLDIEQRIEFINRTAPGLKVADVLGTRVYEYVPAEQHEAMRTCFDRVARTREQDRYDNVYRTPDGDELWWESRVGAVVRDEEVTGFVVFSSDVTQQRALEQQLLQSQKMDAIGQLAGGIAHDFNNLMLVVSANTAFARRAAAEDPEVLHHLEHVESAARRATMLTQRLLAMSRRGQLSTHPLALDQLAAEMIDLLRRLIPAHVEIVANSAAPPLVVDADPAKIEQVLLNLALNARDAMPDGGTLTIETRRVLIEDPVREELPGCEPGLHVVLGVHDTGIGMSKEVRERAFEPFFTTKAIGSGTGLGLSTVYGIIEQHRGGIRVDSEPGRGTRFEVFLPATTAAPITSVSPDAVEVVGGRETILIAEDEALVRRTVSKQLATAGYDVLVASDGDEAVRLFAEDPARIALVFLDVDMPLVSGPDALHRMREARPDLPALFTTGFRGRAGVDGSDPHPTPTLEKPYDAEELLTAVRAAIQGKST